MFCMHLNYDSGVHINDGWFILAVQFMQIFAIQYIIYRTKLRDVLNFVCVHISLFYHLKEMMTFQYSLNCDKIGYLSYISS